MPTLSRRRVAIASARALIAGAPLTDVVQQLIDYLQEHHLLHTVDQLIGDIEYELARQGHVVADVTTAHPLTDGARQHITHFLQQQHEGRVSLREHPDPSLIGGVQIATPLGAFDASVATKLRRIGTTT